MKFIFLYIYYKVNEQGRERPQICIKWGAFRERERDREKDSFRILYTGYLLSIERQERETEIDRERERQERETERERQEREREIDK